MPSLWTDERVEKLKALHLADSSPRRMMEEFGGIFTRNAIIGKLSRLGLCTPLSMPTREARAVRQQRFAPMLRAEPVPRLGIAPDPIQDLPPDQSPFACTFKQLKEPSCRWPMGDPRDKAFLFCGAPKLWEGPYCGRHAHIAYPPRKVSVGNGVDNPVNYVVDKTHKPLNIKTGTGGRFV